MVRRDNAWVTPHNMRVGPKMGGGRGTRESRLRGTPLREETKLRNRHAVKVHSVSPPSVVWCVSGRPAEFKYGSLKVQQVKLRRIAKSSPNPHMRVNDLVSLKVVPYKCDTILERFSLTKIGNSTQ